MQGGQVHFDPFTFVASTAPQHLAGRLVIDDDLQFAVDRQQARDVAAIEHNAVACVQSLADNSGPAIHQYTAFTNPGLDLPT